MPLAPDAESCAVCGARVPLIARPATEDDDVPGDDDAPRAGGLAARRAAAGGTASRESVASAASPPAGGTASGLRPPSSHRADAPLTGSAPSLGPAPLPGAAPLPAPPVPTPPAAFDAAAAARDVRASARPTRPAPSRAADVPPPVGTRVLAYAIDVVAAAAAAGVGLLVVRLTDGGMVLLPALLGLLVAVAQVLAEGLGGATLGARLLGLRTVDERTGGVPGVWRALLRQLVVGAGTLACLVGNWVVAASAAWDSGPRRRGWHDKASGTTVVHAHASSARPARPAAAAGPQGAARPWTPSAPSGPAVPTAPVPAAPAPDASVDDFLFAPAPPAVPVLPPPASATTPVTPPLADLVPAAPAGATPRPAAGLPEVDLLPPPPAAVPGQGGARPAAGQPAAHALDEDLAELEHTRVRDPESLRRRTGTLALHFDTGERVRVVGRGLVGRGPRAEDGQDILHVVVLSDAARSLSRVHAEFGPEAATADEDSAIWVCDRGSTNGTVVIDPAGTARVLPANTRALVGAGWTVRLGDREARVEAD
ncbi:RDD family protein [Cellulomonas dongxiuzhuiae]|uniref:RDD family protein n=1 Tax=Cellulomonas dongxiuzhuiae TaxID=2819979 RepID=UPI001AAEC8AA|nr:RDD family protein [Cellulomonas dongxiuzhuiae]MBO3088417.1 RDD family protein [Cellulomonas dongxiuzhuiae]